MKKKINEFLDRLKVCWYVLTLRRYAFFGYNGVNNGEHLEGGYCFIEDKSEYDTVFLSAISAYAKELSQLKAQKK